ncbi:hypothetical protein BH20ACT2_BH20ACT2_07610 [soil metagenome]
MAVPSGPDPYAVLGIPSGASRREARAAFHRLVELYHPDRLDGLRADVREEAARRLREATAAWQAILTANPRPLRAGAHGAPQMAPRSDPATLHDAELRSVDARRRLHVRWGGASAQATLHALQVQHQRDRSSVRQVEWGAYRIELTGDEVRQFLAGLLDPGQAPAELPAAIVELAPALRQQIGPAGVPDTTPDAVDLHCLLDVLEGDRRYTISAEDF